MQNQEHDNLLEQADGTHKESTQSNQTNSGNDLALDSITAINAEKAEDNAPGNSQGIPSIKDYEQMDIATLSSELKDLTLNYPIQNIKEQVEQIKTTFSHKYEDQLEKKKDIFLQNNPDASEEDFTWNPTAKQQFDLYYKEYRQKRTTYREELDSKLKINLKKRQEIIDNIKDIVETQKPTHLSLKQLNELREQWSKAGAIPKDTYDITWNNYHFQLERFYDLLQLDNQTRELDFKYNLEQKQLLIQRAKELVQYKDIMWACNELHELHRTWKEDIGPVAKQHRDTIWQEFLEVSRVLHSKREKLFDKIKIVERNNLHAKIGIISELDKIYNKEILNHKQWQKEIKNVEKLRDSFYNQGKVPYENSDQVWSLFQLANRNFNTKKNAFYKKLKQDQIVNLQLKRELLEQALLLKDNTNFKETTPKFKSLQEKWKQIGHVPKKNSEKLWNEFKQACNHYFDQMHNEHNRVNTELQSSYLRKKEYLQLFRHFELSGDHKNDLAELKNHINNWNSIGPVANDKRFIEGKFNRILDVLFDKLSLSSRETESFKYSNRLENILESNDKTKLQSEATYIRRKLAEIRSEILQLESTYASIHNPTDTNPFVMTVKKSLNNSKEELKIWQDKLTNLKNLTSK